MRRPLIPNHKEHKQCKKTVHNWLQRGLWHPEFLKHVIGPYREDHAPGIEDSWHKDEQLDGSVALEVKNTQRSGKVEHSRCGVVEDDQSCADGEEVTHHEADVEQALRDCAE